MTTYWCETAWLAAGPEESVRITVKRGRITDISWNVPAADADVVLPGYTLPGAANGHSHTFHRALRGFGAPGESFWSWRDTMYAISQALTPDTYYQLALQAYREMLMAGYTAVGEFHYIHHRPDGSAYRPPHAMENALMAAAADSGIRLTLLDTLYLSAGFGEALSPEQLRFSDGTADQWLARMETYTSPSAKIGAAIHSVRAVDPRSMETAVAWAREHDAPLHVHVSEQKKENLESVRHYGNSPVTVLAHAGVWSARSTAVHATHLDPQDIDTLGDSHAFICLCPSTEADLADGIGPAIALHQAGARLTIGSDQNVLTDPFAEAAAIEMHQRLATGQREIFTSREIISFMSENGYHSLGWDDGGTLQVGALADFVTLDTRKPRYSGVKPDRIPLHAAAGDVIRTIVAGKCVYSADEALPSSADTFSHILNRVRS